ncbi:MAG: hypothetical protein NTY22_03915 [Proteobacteria bacterium]|nr:hypothetical protein [Pseudomonadota bacterium]
MLRKNIIFLLMAFLPFYFAGCSGCGGGAGKSVTVSWTANNEVTVNTSGGGYIVYYSDKQGFDTSSADSVDVPYESGSKAPISTTLSLTPGTWYIKVAAYGNSITGNKVHSSSSNEYTLQVAD